MCRGYLTSVQAGAAFSSAPLAYLADHNTAPPPGQVITTDPASTLVSTLQSKRASEAGKKKAKAAGKGKRPAEALPAEEREPKRGGGGSADEAGPSRPSGSGGSGSIPPAGEAGYTSAQLTKQTIPQLKQILKAWGLALAGKKEELVARVLEHMRGHAS